MLLAAVEANANGLGLICPEQNGAEAVWAGGDDVLGASSLLALSIILRAAKSSHRPHPQCRCKIMFIRTSEILKAKKWPSGRSK